MQYKGVCSKKEKCSKKAMQYEGKEEPVLGAKTWRIK